MNKQTNNKIYNLISLNHKGKLETLTKTREQSLPLTVIDSEGNIINNLME